MTSGWAELPGWLVAPVSAVFADMQGDDPIPGLCVLALGIDESDAVLLGVFEPDICQAGSARG